MILPVIPLFFTAAMYYLNLVGPNEPVPIFAAEEGRGGKRQSQLTSHQHLPQQVDRGNGPSRQSSMGLVVKKRERLRRALVAAERELAKKTVQLANLKQQHKSEESTNNTRQNPVLLTAGDLQRRKEHMHRLCSGIAVSKQKILDPNMWTPGTDAYRERFLNSAANALSSSNFANEDKEVKLFQSRRVLGLDKIARCKLCDVEFEASKLPTSVTYKKILSVRGMWKAEADEAEREADEQHALADKLAKDRAELVRSTTEALDRLSRASHVEDNCDAAETQHPRQSRWRPKKVARICKPNAQELSASSSTSDTPVCKGNGRAPSTSSESPAPQITSSNALDHVPKPHTKFDRRSAPRNSLHKSTKPFPTTLYNACHLCRFCAQFVGSYLGEDQPEEGGEVEHPHQLHHSTKPTAPKEIVTQDRTLFPSASIVVCEAPYSSPSSPLQRRALVGRKKSSSQLPPPTQQCLLDDSTQKSSPKSSVRRNKFNRPSIPIADGQLLIPLAHPIVPSPNITMCLSGSDCDDS